MYKCFSLESNLYQHYVGKITNMEIYFPSQAAAREPPHSIPSSTAQTSSRLGILYDSPFYVVVHFSQYLYSRAGVSEFFYSPPTVITCDCKSELSSSFDNVLDAAAAHPMHRRLVLPSMHTLLLLLLPLVYISAPPPQMR